jgi:hypothetical protein
MITVAIVLAMQMVVSVAIALAHNTPIRVRGAMTRMVHAGSAIVSDDDWIH